MKRFLIYKTHNASEDVLHLFSIEQQSLLFEDKHRILHVTAISFATRHKTKSVSISYDNSEPIFSAK